jgi:hypothetical protein
MKKHLLLAAGILLLFTSVCFAQPQAAQATASPSPKPKPAMTKQQMLKKLSAAETKLWEAWKNHDMKPFKAMLAADGIMVGDMGTANKTETLKQLESPCDVKSYGLSDWKLTMINAGAALLTYKATQDASCGGTALPPAVWASSVWVSRGGKWINLSHQETPAK